MALFPLCAPIEIYSCTCFLKTDKEIGTEAHTHLGEARMYEVHHSVRITLTCPAQPVSPLSIIFPQ